eukprot:Rmarinus@m.6094
MVMQSMRWPFGLLVIFSVACACYINSLEGEFVFDDIHAIVHNRDVRCDEDWQAIFLNDFWGTNLSSSLSHKSYRPLTTLTFRMNYCIHGLDVYGYHVVNVVLYGVVCILYTCFLSILFQNLSISEGCDSFFPSMIIGLLFTTHPIHTEAVANVVGRAELLSGLFFFLCLLSYSRCCQTRGKEAIMWFCMTIFFYLCGVFSKETTIMALPVCFIYDVVVFSGVNFYLPSFKFIVDQSRHISKSTQVGESMAPLCSDVGGTVRGSQCSEREHYSPHQDGAFVFRQICWPRLVALFVTTGFLLAWRLWLTPIPPVFPVSANAASHAPDYLTRLLTFNYLYARNAWILAFPSFLCCDWSMSSIPLVRWWGDDRNGLTLLFYLVLGKLLCECLCQSPNPRRRGLLFSLSLVILPFLPSANIFLYVGFVLAERVLFLPSAGFCAILYLGVDALVQSHSKFREDETTEGALLRKPIESGVAPVSSSKAEVDSFEHPPVPVSKPDPNSESRSDSDSDSEVSVADVTLHDHHSRDRTHRHVAAVATVLVLVIIAYINKTVARSAEWARTESLFDSGIVVNPLNPKMYNNKGDGLFRDGRLQEAISYFLEAHRLDNAYGPPYVNLCGAYVHLALFAEAEPFCTHGAQLLPDVPLARYNLAVLYQLTGRSSQALEELSVSLALDPREAQAHHATCVILQALGDLDGALRHCKETIRLAPEKESWYRSYLDVVASVEARESADHVRTDVEGVPSVMEGKSSSQLLGEDCGITVPEHLYDKATALASSGDVVGATEAINNILRSAPRDVRALNLQGLLLYQSGNPTAAFEHYLAALEVHPDDVTLRRNLDSVMTTLWASPTTTAGQPPLTADHTLLPVGHPPYVATTADISSSFASTTTDGTLGSPQPSLMPTGATNTMHPRHVDLSIGGTAVGISGVKTGGTIRTGEIGSESGGIGYVSNDSGGSGSNEGGSNVYVLDASGSSGCYGSSECSGSNGSGGVGLGLAVGRGSGGGGADNSGSVLVPSALDYCFAVPSGPGLQRTRVSVQGGDPPGLQTLAGLPTHLCPGGVFNPAVLPVTPREESSAGNLLYGIARCEKYTHMEKDKEGAYDRWFEDIRALGFLLRLQPGGSMMVSESHTLQMQKFPNQRFRSEDYRLFWFRGVAYCIHTLWVDGGAGTGRYISQAISRVDFENWTIVLLGELLVTGMKPVEKNWVVYTRLPPEPSTTAAEELFVIYSALPELVLYHFPGLNQRGAASLVDAFSANHGRRAMTEYAAVLEPAKSVNFRRMLPSGLFPEATQRMYSLSANVVPYDNDYDLLLLHQRAEKRAYDHYVVLLERGTLAPARVGRVPLVSGGWACRGVARNMLYTLSAMIVPNGGDLMLMLGEGEWQCSVLRLSRALLESLWSDIH